MKVNSVELEKRCRDPKEFPRFRLPEIAFAGRSNVGKSSLINTLLTRKRLVAVSSTPGKTRAIDFFRANDTFRFVDLPGYGYAKVSRAAKRQWGRVMTDYLRQRDPLRLAVQLLDARHKPSDKDHNMLELLDAAEVPILIAATKIDKLKRAQRAQRLSAIRNHLELDDDALVIAFSGVTGEGKRPIWDVIDGLVSRHV